MIQLDSEYVRNHNTRIVLVIKCGHRVILHITMTLYVTLSYYYIVLVIIKIQQKTIITMTLYVTLSFTFLLY